MRRLRRPRDRDAAESELAARLVWILGSPRSGSTWLLGMLKAEPRAIALDEPSVGVHLAVPASALTGLQAHRDDPERMRLNDLRAGAQDYFFSDRFAEAWRPAARSLILVRIGAQVSEAADARGISRPLVVIKEPHGSVGADVLMSLLPESRLLFLLRDGRDVVDSELDAASRGSWATEVLGDDHALEPERRLDFIRERANAWACRTAAVRRAYEAHDPDLRLLLRYEDLRADPLQGLRSLRDWLGLGLGDHELGDLVDRTSFERIPDTGPGRFARAATPGLWRQNLAPEEQAVVEEIAGPLLRELGYG